MKFDFAISGVFRGSRPKNIQSLYLLWAKGVRTIVNLEEGWGNLNPFIYKNAKEDWLAMGGKYYECNRSNLFPAGNGELYGTYLLIEMAKTFGDVFVHCFAGVDRTGEMIAYLQVRAGDDPVYAWDDAQKYGMHKRYFWWKPKFLKNCEDVWRK